MALVLFDLDHTLLSGDSEGAWVNYLREKDFVDNKFLERKREFVQQGFVFLDRSGQI